MKSSETRLRKTEFKWTLLQFNVGIPECSSLFGLAALVSLNAPHDFRSSQKLAIQYS